MKYSAIPVKTGYIRPGEGISMIVERAGELVLDGDFLVISETPVSVAQGDLVDESEFEPSLLAIFLADIWSKYIWGYLLGPLLGIKERTIRNLRRLPPEARSHKEVVLRYYGLKHALKPASEAGIDLSNVPGTLVSLLPENPAEAARRVADKLMDDFDREVTVVIADTDATYRLLGRYFTALPVAAPGIIHDTGILGYLAGRFSSGSWPTPLASSRRLDVETLLEVVSVAESYQMSHGPRSTVYEMAEELEESPGRITAEMLESVEHTPAIIVRPEL
ncbi:Gamma-glutamyl ligase [Methanothermobacter wolfeii]|nr:Gamma-glutamyl ligase [Methanothermobacter wolfeii]